VVRYTLETIVSFNDVENVLGIKVNYDLFLNSSNCIHGVIEVMPENPLILMSPFMRHNVRNIRRYNILLNSPTDFFYVQL